MNVLEDYVCITDIDAPYPLNLGYIGMRGPLLPFYM